MYDRPFRWWVQSVMPLVFDDSLSYYEVLAKLTKYIEGLTGDVEQIEKILATIEGIEDVTQFTEFLERIQAEIGNLDNLQTETKANLVSAINEVALKADIAYWKPPTGIPESDLSQEVKDKLNKTVSSTEYIINNVKLNPAPANNSPTDLGLGTYTVPDGGIPWNTLSSDVRDRITGSGSGGTTNYDDLNNKPQINGHTLNAGNNTAETLELGTYNKPIMGIPESDLTAEVQEKLNTSGGIADSESSFVATRDYAAGELVYINGQLYRTKYNILTGTNLIPGNNIEVTDISSELEKINSDIDALQSDAGPDSWNLTDTVQSYSYLEKIDFFEYFNCIGRENYNFIVEPADPSNAVAYYLDVCKRDGTVVLSQHVTEAVDYANRKRFTFVPTDSGEYYCKFYRTASGYPTTISAVKVTIEYTQSQGISELWTQVNKASQLGPRVTALETLTSQQQGELDGLDGIPGRVSALEESVAGQQTQIDALNNLPPRVENLETDVENLKSDINRAYIEQSANGNPIKLTDSMTANLIALSASENCVIDISGKNMISADFEAVDWNDRADQTILYGKGAYEYIFPSRVNIEQCGNNTIKLTPTASQVITTGVGLFLKVNPSTGYTLSYDMDGNGTVSVMFYDGEKTYTNTAKEAASSGYSFITRDNTHYICISFRGLTQNESVTFTNMQLEEGDVVTAFTPYQNKQSISVNAGAQADVTNILTYYPVTIIYGETTSAQISVNYYASTQDYIDSKDEAIIADIQKNAFVSSYNILDGWEPHAKAFSEMMLDIEKTEGFMFFTDTHFMAKQTESEWKKYAYAVFAYLEQLYYASPCSFVLHGGDWLGSGEAKTNAIYKLSTLNGIFRSKFNKFALLVGNHETGNQMQGNTPMTHDTLAATLLANVGKTYYKFHANTFEMYCFDSWVSGALDNYANEQIAWFADSLMSETAEHIAIAIHILYDENNLKPFGDELTKCAAAYNSRTTYTYNGNTYDFSSVSGTGKVAFVIAGHEHNDASGTVNGIPYIMTTNTTGYSETTFDNLPLPVDLMKVNWSNEKLIAYRASRGESGTTREITILV